MKSKRKKTAAPAVDTTPRIRRAYFECRFGQLHVATAFPVGGGFDDHPTLVCLHRCPLSSRVFRPFMEEMGRDRSVYAPDLPGCGESDAPPSKPAIEDYAAALADFLDQMHFRQADVLGHHTGSLIAADLALLRPQVVRRLVLVGLPVLNAEERATWARSMAPFPAAADGSHLAVDWQRSVFPGSSPADLGTNVEDFSIRLHNGPNVWWMPNAALGYLAAERLPLVTQPALLIRARDHLWEASLRAKPWMRQLKLVDLPEHGDGVFRSAPREIAAAARSFLDR
ncbi:MAG TPA: alpha/beta hydrolase [Steroidobacteraceae bacterium]|nr:alpha/beta hydrolase [Steroidobacteraceae bacterium]